MRGEVREAIFNSDPHFWRRYERLLDAASDAVMGLLREDGPRSGEDGTARLCRALYGRDAKPRDYLGGAEARMLHDAADKIADAAGHMTDAADALEHSDWRCFQCARDPGMGDTDLAMYLRRAAAALVASPTVGSGGSDAAA